VLNSAISFIDRNANWLPFLIVLLAAFSHNNHMHLGPRGHHVWRQCNTLAVAKNFYQEEMNILRPRVDHRRGTSGVTGTAFPFFEYLVAAQYKILGFSESRHRYVQFFFYGLLILGGFFLGKTVFDNAFQAAVVSWILAWSPELYYHGINALPDISALALSVWALIFYLHYSTKRDQPKILILWFALLIMLAGLIKIQYLLFGGIALIHALFSKKRSVLILVGIAVLLASIPVITWYVHAIELRESSGLKDIGLVLNPADSLSEAWTILWQNISSDFPELLLGYLFLPLLFIGLFRWWKSANRRLKMTSIFIGVGLMLFHIIELDQMLYHGYYMMPYIIFFALACGYGMGTLLKMDIRIRATVVVFILLQPFLTFSRINHRYTSDEKAQIPTEFLDDVAMETMKTFIDESSNVLMYGDESGCIFFYYLQCKGWNIPPSQKVNSKELGEFVSSNDIKTIILYNKNIVPYGWEDSDEILAEGDFLILRMRR